MEPVNNSGFQVLNCPANFNNRCKIAEEKRYCYDATFCPIKQQVIYNWALLGIYGHFNTRTNIGFQDIPQNNIDLLQPYPHRLLKLEDVDKIVTMNIEFNENLDRDLI